MNLGTSIPTRTLARKEFPYDFHVLGRTPQEGWLLAVVNSRASRMERFAHFFPNDTELFEKLEALAAAEHPRASSTAAVFVLDSNLEETETIPLPADWHTVDAISQDLRWAVRSTPVEFLLYDRSTGKTRSFPHQGWRTYTGSSAYFDQHHRFWCVFPGSQRTDRLTVIEPESASVVHEVPLANDQGFASFLQGPLPGSIVVQIACGQDGSDIFLANERDATIQISRLNLLGRTNVSFAPGGHEFVTGSHDDDQVKIHSFPECKELCSLAEKVIFAEDEVDRDRIGYHAIYLDADHILVDTNSGRLIVIRRSDLKVLGTIWPEGFALEKQSADVGYCANASLRGWVSARKIFMAMRSDQLLLVEVDLENI